jgi:hypothetical protein
MSRPRVGRTHRVLAAVVASLLLLSVALAVDRTRGEDAVGPGGDGVAPAGSVVPSPSPSETPEAAASPDAGASVALVDPDTAAAVGADKLLAAGLAAAQGPWRDLGHPTWRIREEQPVYVVAAELSPAGDAVSADVVVAVRLAQEADELVLRLLPAAAALAGSDVTVEVELDGLPVTPVVDREGARLLVPLGEARAAGDAVSLRVRLAYRLLPPDEIVDDGGPAGFWLLATHPRLTTLGHWLPLLTLPGDDGPLIPWGDVGGFPTAVWSVRVVHDGTLVTGGRDDPCPEPPELRRCTWSRGIALRDDAAILYADEPALAEFERGGTNYRVLAGERGRVGVDAVLSETVAAADAFERRFGPLAWAEVDTVPVPLGSGAAGMEFPGLILVEEDEWTDLDGGFGTAVLAHEVAHQWFHGLVGNGSLSSPVVDESLAEYLTYLFWRDTFGEGAAARWADTRLRQRYAAGRPASGPEGAPARPLGEFAGGRDYSRLVYARAPLAWVVAEDRVGVPGVEAFLAGLVDRYGLGEVSDDSVVEDATTFDPRLGEVLQRYWLDPDPVG